MSFALRVIPRIICIKCEKVIDLDGINGFSPPDLVLVDESFALQ